MRLSGVGDKDPGEVRSLLERYGVEDVFFLVSLPPSRDKIERIRKIRFALGDGIRFHLWFLVYRNPEYVKNNPEDALVSTGPLPEEGWVNPLSHAYERDLLSWIRNATSELDADGVFLDYFYVPWPGPFDNASLASFSSSLGRNVTMTQVTGNPDLLGRFFKWRNEGIVHTLRAIREETKGLKLSVFIQMWDEGDRLARGVDLRAFDPYVDFFVSNTYHVAARKPATWVGGGVKALRAEGAGQVWAGIQAYGITPDQVEKATRSAVKAGAGGVVLFRYGTMTEEILKRAHLALKPRFLPPGWIFLAAAAAVVSAATVGLRRRTRKSRRSKKKKRRPHK